MDEDYCEAVLDVVAQVPAGHAVTYGQVAELVGGVLHRGGPRLVGQVMATMGGAVPWWRVVNAAGSPPPAHVDEALRRLRLDGCALTASGTRVNLRTARWDAVGLRLPEPG